MPKNNLATIKVKRDTHEKLLEILSKLQMERKKRVTYDDVIKWLFEKAKP